MTDPRLKNADAGGESLDFAPNFDQMVCEAIIATAERIDSDEGLYETLRRIDALSGAVQSQRPQRPGHVSWLQRLWPWLAARLPTIRAVPAPVFGALAVVATLEAAIIAGLVFEGAASHVPYSDYRSAGRSAVATEPFLRVTFSGDAREADIRHLLRENALEIVAGPSQLGEYYLLAPTQKSEGARARLAGSALVGSVVLAQRLPDLDPEP